MQKVTDIGVGFDALPESLRHSPLLTGNELAQIAALTALPDRTEALADPKVQAALAANPSIETLHQLVREALAQNDVNLAARLGLSIVGM